MALTTSKRCIVFRVFGGARNDPKSRCFAFETDAEKVQFVDYFTGRLANFAEFCADGCDVFLSEYGYPTPTESNRHHYNFKMCIHLLSLYNYGNQPDHMIFPCQTDEEKLAFATWVEKEMFQDHFHDGVRVEFAEITFPFDAALVNSFMLDKTGEPGIAAAVVSAAAQAGGADDEE